MKKIILLTAAAIIAAGTALAKDIQTVVLTTDPQMHCANCEKKIKNFFRFEKRIKKIETDCAAAEKAHCEEAEKNCCKATD